ncbi:MAG: hypothetical protein AB4290_23245 [Spirulina sp.]
MQDRFKRRKDFLNKRLAQFHEELLIAEDQLETTIDDVQAKRLEQKIENFLKKIETLEQQLQQLDSKENNENRTVLEFDKNMRKIDFSQALDIFESVLGKFERGKGAAVFLLHDSFQMLGELYWQEICDRLSEMTRDFRHYPIELSADFLQNEIGLLHRLAAHLGIESKDRHDIQVIAETLCNSLQNGSIIFLEFKRWEQLPDRAEAIAWFVDEFWSTLLESFVTTCQDRKHRNVKLIAAIDAEEQLDSECFQLSCYCNLDEFFPDKPHKNKIINVPLKCWTEEDIQNWLDAFAPIKSSETVDRLAKHIYNKSRGFPLSVREALRKEWQNFSCIQ